MRREQREWHDRAQAGYETECGTARQIHWESRSPLLVIRGRRILEPHGARVAGPQARSGSAQEVTRIEVGKPQANGRLSPNGGIAFVKVRGTNEVAVMAMSKLAVVGRLPTDAATMGRVLLDASLQAPAR